MKKFTLLLGLSTMLFLVSPMISVVQAPPPVEQSVSGGGIIVDVPGNMVFFQLYADEWPIFKGHVTIIVRASDGSLLLRMLSTDITTVCIPSNIGTPAEIMGEALVWYGGSMTTGSFFIKGYDNDGAGTDYLWIGYINDGTQDIYGPVYEPLIGGNIEIKGQS